MATTSPKDMERRSSAATLSDMEMFIFPELIYSIMDPASISSLESAYDPASARIGTDRPAATDVQMFGYYIQHNIGIGFRTFASGIRAIRHSEMARKARGHFDWLGYIFVGLCALHPVPCSA